MERFGDLGPFVIVESLTNLMFPQICTAPQKYRSNTLGNFMFAKTDLFWRDFSGANCFITIRMARIQFLMFLDMCNGQVS